MIKLKIGMRGGHSKNCLGAIGIKNEWLEMQKLYLEVEKILKDHGHIIINCNSNASNESNELKEGITKANNNSIDLFISLHMNSFNSKGHGVESWIYSNGSKSHVTAERLVNNFSKLGFTNRGVKIGGGYRELHAVNAPAIIFETCFCDNATDCKLFDNVGLHKLALNICNAIDPTIDLNGYIKIDKPIVNNSTKLLPNGEIHKTGVVTASVLNVRNGRGTNSNVIGSFKRGDKVELWYCLNGWASCNFNGKTGFIYSEYVKI